MPKNTLLCFTPMLCAFWQRLFVQGVRLQHGRVVNQLAQQNDEWIVGIRYLTLTPATYNEALPESQFTQPAADSQNRWIGDLPHYFQDATLR